VPQRQAGRGERVDAAVVEDAGLACAGVAAFGIGPAIAAFDADDHADRHLIVATRLPAGKPAVLVVVSERHTEEIAPWSLVHPLLMAPQSAGMGSEMAARPAPILPRSRAKIGGCGGTRHRQHCRRDKQPSRHGVEPRQ